MKRRTLKFVACAAITAFMVCATACGGSDDGKTSEVANIEEQETEPEVEDEEEVTEPEDVIETEEEVSEPEDEGHLYPDSMYESVTDGLDDEAADAVMDMVDSLYEADASGAQTLEDYFTDPTVKSAFEYMFTAVGEEGIDVSIDVTGNDLVFIYQITDRSLITDGLAENLAANLESADLSAQVDAFDDMVREKGACTVTMRYFDPDGNLLAEHTYSNN